MCTELIRFIIIISWLIVVFGNIVLNLTFISLIYIGITSVTYTVFISVTCVNATWTYNTVFFIFFFFSFSLTPVFIGRLNIKRSFKNIVLLNISKLNKLNKFNKFDKFGLKV